jgi:anti-sigma factor RsiW
MECHEAKDLIGAFTDGELPEGDRRIVADHLEGCTECQAELQALLALRAKVRLGGTFLAPKELAERISDALDAVEEAPVNAPRMGRPTWWMPSALAASHVAALAIGGAVALAVFGSSAQLTRAERSGPVLTAHIRALMTDEFASVQSNNTHNVKPWFDGKLDYSPVVVDLAQAGYPLVAGRVDYLGSRAVAALEYSRGKHKISVFEVPATDQESPPASSSLSETEARGYTTFGFTAGGYGYWVVSDLNATDLKSFAERLKAAAGNGGESPER